MTKLKTTAVLATAVIATTIGTGLTAQAQDEPKTMLMVEYTEIDPAMQDQWTEGWKTIVKTAHEVDYPYTERMMTHRNKRWKLVEVANYADIDGVYAARNQAQGDEGQAISKGLAKMDAAEIDSLTFTTRYIPELSYQPDGYAPGNYGRIDTFRFKAGHASDMKKVLKDFKELSASAGAPNGYNVYWDGMGTQGRSVTIVSSAENPLALAQQDAADEEAMKGKKDELEKVYDRFFEIALGTTTENMTYKPDLSINVKTE